MRHVLNLRTMTLLGLLAVPATAMAQQQLVSFDIVYTAEFYDGTVKGENYHHLVKPAPTEPASWTTPVDYSKGTVYIHQEVMTKPSARDTIITICFDGDLEGYGCIDTKTYTTTGVHETVAPITSTWQYGKIAWGKRRTEYHLVIKDPKAGGNPGGNPKEAFVPSMMRIVMTIVPPGGTYTPPPPLSGGDGRDGGAPAADAGQATADADTVIADAASARPDLVSMNDPIKQDAASSKPSPKADAAAKPPVADPDPEQPGTGGAPASHKSGGGCAVAGTGGLTAGPLLLFALLAAQLRRRRRR
jgi:MYXO-CTERM domain-containing protein